MQARDSVNTAHSSYFWAKYVAIGLFTGACLGLAYMVTAQAPPPTLVQVDEVQQGMMRQTLPIIGRTVVRESGVVAAAVAGPVAEIQVHVGDRLVTGEVIATLVDDRRRAVLERYMAEWNLQKARIRTAAARLTLARQERDRLAKLKNSPAFPKARYEDKGQEAARYRSELAEAKAALGRAEADRRIADIELARTVIRAPFPGVVTVRYTSPGAYLKVGDRVITLLNDSDLEIEAEVPAQHLRGLRQGIELEVELENKSRQKAIVRAIVPDENPLTRTRQVRLSPWFDPAQHFDMADNQSVMIHIPVAKNHEVISVHKDAIVNRRGKQLVYVVMDDIAEIRPVQLGEAVGTRFVVISGLKPGELTVIRGNERLRPGQRVHYERNS